MLQANIILSLKKIISLDRLKRREIQSFEDPHYTCYKSITISCKVMAYKWLNCFVKPNICLCYFNARFLMVELYPNLVSYAQRRIITYLLIYMWLSWLLNLTTNLIAQCHCYCTDKCNLNSVWNKISFSMLEWKWVLTEYIPVKIAQFVVQKTWDLIIKAHNWVSEIHLINSPNFFFYFNIYTFKHSRSLLLLRR